MLMLGWMQTELAQLAWVILGTDMGARVRWASHSGQVLPQVSSVALSVEQGAALKEDGETKQVDTGIRTRPYLVGVIGA